MSPEPAAARHRMGSRFLTRLIRRSDRGHTLAGAIASATIALSLLLASTALARPIDAARVHSAGLPRCTIFGTPAPETLRGTSGDDVICAVGGDDRVLGRGGN